MGHEQGVSAAFKEKNRKKAQKCRDRKRASESALALAAGAVSAAVNGAAVVHGVLSFVNPIDVDGAATQSLTTGAAVIPVSASRQSGEATSRQAKARRDKEAREAIETAAATKRRDEAARELATRRAATAAMLLATQGSAPKLFRADWQGESKRTIGGASLYKSMLLGGVVVNVGDWVEVQGETEGRGGTSASSSARKRSRESQAETDIWVGRIIGLWRDSSGVDRAALAWAFKPEDMRCGRLPSHGSRELATSQKADIVEVETFIRRARVISASALDDRADPNASSSDESVSRDTHGGGARSPLRPRSRIAVYTAQTYYDEATASTRVLFFAELESPPAYDEGAVTRVADGTAHVGTLTGLGLGVASGTGVHIGGGGGRGRGRSRCWSGSWKPFFCRSTCRSSSFCCTKITTLS